MTNGNTGPVAVPFLLNFVGIILSVRSSQVCSPFCVCDTWYELYRASCMGRHLYSVHTGVPSDVQALDLSDNVISSLDSYELANAGLKRLKYLNLSGNAISEIGLNAFRGLSDLTVLDLSRNRLHDILDDVFIKNENLRIVKLSRNNFNSHVPKLRSFWLTELSLDSCQISHLPPDTFNGLALIRRLDLSNNLMIQMPSAVVQTLLFLKKLSLQGNPWSCNKIMYDLETQLSQKNVEFDEVCSKKKEPKKFEKMILRPFTKPQNYHRSAITNDTAQKTKSVSKDNTSNVSSSQNLSTCENTLKQMKDMSSVKDNLFLYWFMLTGFVFGVASGMIVTYIWLTTQCGCCRRCRHREGINDNSQRLDLLINAWNLQNLIVNDTDRVESCPSTPPPPYREVLLRPSLYRSLSTASILNNNSGAYGERYT